MAPDKPMQNGICEVFDGRRRVELLDETLFFASTTPAPRSPDGRCAAKPHFHLRQRLPESGTIWLRPRASSLRSDPRGAG